MVKCTIKDAKENKSNFLYKMTYSSLSVKIFSTGLGHLNITLQYINNRFHWSNKSLNF